MERFNRYTIKQIASELGISYGAARQRVSRSKWHKYKDNRDRQLWVQIPNKEFEEMKKKVLRDSHKYSAGDSTRDNAVTVTALINEREETRKLQERLDEVNNKLLDVVSQKEKLGTENSLLKRDMSHIEEKHREDVNRLNKHVTKLTVANHTLKKENNKSWWRRLLNVPPPPSKLQNDEE